MLAILSSPRQDGINTPAIVVSALGEVDDRIKASELVAMTI